jgi:signal transduction histidine kinase
VPLVVGGGDDPEVEPRARVIQRVLRWDDADRLGEDAPPPPGGYRAAVDAHAFMLPRRVLSKPSGDVLLAALVVALSEIDVWAPLSFVGRQTHRPALAIVFLACSLALVWRRRAPLAVLAFVYTSSSLLYLAVGAPEALGTFLPPLVALYSVGRYSEARSLVLAGPLALIGTALHDLQDSQFRLSGPAIFFWALLAAAWPLGRAFHQRERAVDALSRQADELRHEREAEARAAVAAERARIARELHDVVGHGVSIVVLQLVAALGMLDNGDLTAARQRLLATERSSRQTLAEMRRLLGLLDEDDAASLAPQPGLTELERLVADTRAAGVEVELVVSGDRVELSAGLELAAYRVAQEALTNVIKHAQPATAHVRLAYSPSELVVEVADDGDGPPGSLDDGRGLAGMRERVALYAGELTVGVRPQGGFGVRARFPIEDA